jgi:hypothetical protein
MNVPLLFEGLCVTNFDKPVEFVFRSFIDDKIGYAYFYPVEKSIDLITVEMEIMASPQSVITSYGRNMRVWHNEDGSIDIPIDYGNLFNAIRSNGIKVIKLTENKDNFVKLSMIYSSVCNLPMCDTDSVPDIACKD